MSTLDPAGDPHVLLAGLVDGVARALPDASVLDVERSRSLADRLAGRPGTVTSLILHGESERLTLGTGKSDRLVAETARVSGGVVISRRELPLGEWLNAFAGQVSALAAARAGDAAAAAKALIALGVQSAGSDVVITEDAIDRGLVDLPARLEGRVPAPAVERVARIAASLRETLPRVEADVEQRILVARTATVYLPETLRAYLALPAAWAETHVLRTGQTAAEVLLEQLAALEEACDRMRDASLERNAADLLVNGRFLSDRFAQPSLTLGQDPRGSAAGAS